MRLWILFPDLTGDPATVIAALQGRADYARSLKTNGYSKYTAFLTDAEAETLGATLGKDTPTEIKAAILGTLVAGFEGDAGRVLSEAKINDPVMVFSGQLMASGGDKSVVEGALRGQQMLDEGLIQRPSKAISVAAISPDIAAALSVIPEAQASEAGLIKFALAIYANDARGVDPNSDDATKRMDTAINKALGQSTNRRGQVTGGVQKMRGNDVLLPVGVAGEDVNGALEAAFGASPNTYLGQVDTYWSRITSIGRVAQDNPAQPDIWTSAGISSSKGSMPMMGGKPLDPKHFRNGNIRIVPIPKSGPAAYRMEYVSGNGFVGDVLDASGSVYQFDIKALIEASAP